MPGRKTRKTPSSSKPDAEDPLALHWDGVITWIHSEGCPEKYVIHHAVFRDDREFAMDCDCAPHGDTPRIYTIVLRRKSPLMFLGEWTMREGGTLDKGTCSCRFYSNQTSVALIGEWFEDGDKFNWFAELSPHE